MNAPEQLSFEYVDHISRLYDLGFNITPADIQSAINGLDPNSPTGLHDAEVIIDFATIGTSQHPESEEWSDVTSNHKVF
jgi:hypothetical protein